PCPAPLPPTRIPTLLPYTTLFRSIRRIAAYRGEKRVLHGRRTGFDSRGPGTEPTRAGLFQTRGAPAHLSGTDGEERKGKRKRTSDRKSTRLNSSHVATSYAVFCLK